MGIVNSIFHINTFCFSKCVTCDFWKKKDGPQFSLDDLKNISLQMKNNGVDQIMITGGEPLAHPDIFLFIDFLKTIGIHPVLNTNGLSIKKHLKQIINTVDECVVSMDGANSNTYKKIRGIDGFNLVLNNIKSLYKSYKELHGQPPKITLRVTVQKHNLFELNHILNLGNSLNCKVALNPIDSSSDNFGRIEDNRNNEFIPSESELKLFEGYKTRITNKNVDSCWPEEKFNRLIRYFKMCNSNKHEVKNPSPPCSIPYSSLVIEANGDIKSCFYHKIGNYYDNDNLFKYFKISNVKCMLDDLIKSGKCDNCRGKIFN